MIKSRRAWYYKVVTAVVIFSLVILSAVGIYQFKRANDLEIAINNQYAHSFYEVADYVDDVDLLLKKLMLTDSARQMSVLSSDLYMKTAGAKANLAQIPNDEINLADTSKFLSQVSDYASYLSRKTIQNESVTDEEYSNLRKLSEYAGAVRQHMESIRTELTENELRFLKKSNASTVYASDEFDFLSGLESMEKSFQDYPALIYDGPFSEHIETLKPSMLEGRPLFSSAEALYVAQSFLGENRNMNLRLINENEGKIPCYNFLAQNDGREISISVTKQGGYVLYMLDNQAVNTSTLTASQAIEAAQNFLNKQGFYHLKSSYYEKTGNTMTINFAAIQNDVTLYSDLIKVKVSLSQGEIVGYEAKGYIMSHKIREFPTTLMQESEVRTIINSHLSVDYKSLALIPLDSTREVLCYEYYGQIGEQKFLLYMNAETGDEEKILLLLESEDGILTV